MSGDPAAAKGNARGSGYERNANDWYVEPPWTVDDLLDAEPFDGDIWDPACGRGTIPIVAARRGFPSYGSDLVDRGYGKTSVNFFDLRHASAPNIISNPPFNVIQPWIDHALRLTRPALGKVAIFARLALLEGVDRGAWFPTTPLARVWVCSGRVPCPPGEQAPAIDVWQRNTIGGGFIAYAWFVWQHGHSGEPALGWLPHPTVGSSGQPELALG